jgi:hypothetical protein
MKTWAVLVVLAPLTAWADTETVHLANGSVYSGDLVEKIPGDHVTIKLATGDVKRFEWSDIVPKTPAVQPSAPSLAVAAPPPQQPDVLPVMASVVPLVPARPAHVQFEADTKGALLVRVDSFAVNNRISTAEAERPVCYAPCAADVDANAQYYVSGAYITRSNRFAIPDGSSVLHARTGSDGISAAGGWLVGFGVLSSLTGAIATPVAFATATQSSGWNGWEYFGVTTLIAGAGLILLGIPFLIAGRTHVALGDADVAHHTRLLPNGFRF